MSKDKHSERQEMSDPSLWDALPPNFLWGASTSAYQIEGATHEGGRGRSIWDDFAATAGKTYRGETGDSAVDHYHRMEEDIELLAGLGLNAYCFSIAWPRVLPNGTGTVNAQGLDFYERLVDALLMRGIEPVAKLYHWDLPSALQERGGWLNRDTAYAFADYADHVTRRLSDRVKWWVTHNEPWCTAYLGHSAGVHAPGLRDLQMGVNAAHHILLSHGLAVPRIRTNAGPHAHVGISLDYYPIHAQDDDVETLQGVERASTFRNRWFFDPIFKKHYPEHLFSNLDVAPPAIHAGDLETIGAPIDFLGLNYYSRWIIRGQSRDGEHAAASPEASQQGYEQVTSPLPTSTYTEMGWEIYPAGLLEALEQIQREYNPPALLITESGAAFPDHWDGDSSIHDVERAEYLRGHIASVARAAAQGVPVRGYFAWSLLDNFEWSEGYSKRFGIVYVDFPSQKRIVKDSGRWYAAFVAALRAGQKRISI